MRRSPLYRTLFIITLFALLVVSLPPEARAGGMRHHSTQAAPVLTNPWAGLWSFVLRLWGKNGCGIDPDGRCLPSVAPPAENGCGLDPSGQCTPSASAPKNGCGLDPNGRCVLPPPSAPTENRLRERS